MSNDPTGAVAPVPQPTIHEADRTTNLSGIVYYGPEITFDEAVARRAAGEDVVVRGPDGEANRRLAYQIEAAVGPPDRVQAPHRSAGPAALPHYHQLSRNPIGHTFYEVGTRRARRRP